MTWGFVGENSKGSSDALGCLHIGDGGWGMSDERFAMSDEEHDIDFREKIALDSGLFALDFKAVGPLA